jgi:EmrB/QacA subfamily drug resistance transporter
LRPAPSAARWTLLVAILGSTLAFVDSTIVNVALPVLQRDLGATVDQLQWVIEAYALLLSSLLLPGGALGDRLGRRRVFSAGIALFAVSSAACGLAPGPAALIVARAVQGAGAALLMPGSLALITAAYDEAGRGRAIGTWSAASAVAGALGPVTGGFIVSHASWRWIFFLNLPLAAAALVLAQIKVPESRDEHASGRIDLGGTALATAGLFLIVFALVDAGRLGGLGSAPVLALLGAGAATLAAFVAVERRVANPMVPPSLFRSRTFTGANVITLLLYAAIGGSLFFLPFVLIQVHGYAPAEAGAALLPLILLIAATSRWAGGLTARLGARPLLVVGPAIAATGFLLLSLPGAGGSYWTTWFPGLAVLGFGMGVTVAPLTTAVMGSVSEQNAGAASGINNAVARTAALLAIAVLGAVVVKRFDAALAHALDAMALPAEARAAVWAERSKLAGAAVPQGLGAGSAAAVRQAIDAAFVEAVRAAMRISAALAALASISAWATIEPAARLTPRDRAARPLQPPAPALPRAPGDPSR